MIYIQASNELYDTAEEKSAQLKIIRNVEKWCTSSNSSGFTRKARGDLAPWQRSESVFQGSVDLGVYQNSGDS